MEAFDTPMHKIWSICACATPDYLLIHTTYKFSNIIGNLHGGYPFINGSRDEVVKVVTSLFLEILSSVQFLTGNIISTQAVKMKFARNKSVKEQCANYRLRL